jgi:hypothetical protein
VPETHSVTITFETKNFGYSLCIMTRLLYNCVQMCLHCGLPCACVGKGTAFSVMLAPRAPPQHAARFEIAKKIQSHLQHR